MMKRGFWCGLASALVAFVAHAEPKLDAMSWLQRSATAADRLTYSGVFVYHNGTRSETSRIAHLHEAGNEFEKIEVMDGSPRVVVRTNDEVRCFLPDAHLQIVERRGVGRQDFPARLPARLSGLTEHYTLRKGATDRVVGLDSQAILIEPKDELRYGHLLWIDMQSGLLLKAGLVNERGEIMETFAFTELKIGGPLDRATLSPSPATGKENWKIQDARTSEVRGADAWIFRNPLPGFRRISGMRRQVRPDAPEMTHLIFSDGLAAISVFIEPLATRDEKIDTGPFALGAINGYRRVVGDYFLVVMGDVPPAALKRLADGMEPKRK